MTLQKVPQTACMLVLLLQNKTLHNFFKSH